MWLQWHQLQKDFKIVNLPVSRNPFSLTLDVLEQVPSRQNCIAEEKACHLIEVECNICKIFLGLLSLLHPFGFLGGIPGDHLIIPVSGHGVPSPMQLRLGQKNVWTEEYVDQEEQGAMDGVDAVEEEEEEEEEHCLDGEDKGPFEGRDWENEEEEEDGEDEDGEEEGDKNELEWEVAEFPSKAPQHTFSQHQYYKPQEKTEDGGVPVKEPVPQTHADTFRPHLGRNRASRRLGHWRHFGSHRSVGFRLTQHWKSWRLRAQWLCSQGPRYQRRWQRHSVHSKRKAIRRYQHLLSADDGAEEKITGFHGGTNTFFFCAAVCVKNADIRYKTLNISCQSNIG